MANSFGSSAFSGSSFGGSFGSSYSSARSGGGLSLREIMMLNLARQQSKQPHEVSFLHSVEHGGGKLLGAIGHPIGWTFHQIERPFHGLEQGIYDSLNTPLGAKGIEQFGRGFAHGFTKGNSPSGSQILKHDQHVGNFFQHHHIAAGLAGFGIDVATDPLSFVGFGVKGTKEAVQLSRTLLRPNGWADIVQSGKKLKALAAANPKQNYSMRIALHKLDKELYRSAKQIALKRGEKFDNKEGNWFKYHFEENPTNIKVIPQLVQRNDLAASAAHEALLNDARFKTVGFAGKNLFQFGKNIAYKEHNSALAKLFSNASRYGQYYPLSVIGMHAGVRPDVIDMLMKGLEAKGLSQKEVNKQISEYIKEFQANRVKHVLAASEGRPMQIVDKRMRTQLRSYAKQVAQLRDIHGGTWTDIAHAIHTQLPKDVIDHLNLEGKSAATAESRTKALYAAANDPTALDKLASVPNPGVTAGNLKSLDKTNFPGIAVSSKGKSFLAEYRRQFLKDENLHPFIKQIQHYRGILKRGYTGANPFGYAIRNSMTDVWNAALTHTPVVRGMVRYSKPAYGMIQNYEKVSKKLMAGIPLTDAEKKIFMQVHKMHDLGILSGLFAKDVQEDKSIRDQLHPKTGRQILRETKGRRLLHAYATTAVHANEIRENTGRVAHYLYRINKGQSPEEAANFVKAAHFDYQDITPFEQTFLKSVFPFYTWYRKNVPFQMRMALEKPGQFTRYFHAANESQQASGDKGNQAMPSYLMESPSTIRLPFGKNLYADPALGLQDLQKVEHPISELKKSVGPPANLLTSYLSGKDTFSGADLTSKRLTPTNPLLAKVLGVIPGLNHLPGGQTGTTQRLVNGKEVKTPGISPWANFLIGQIPGATMLQGANPVSVGHRGLPSFNVPGLGPFPTGPALSYFGGQTLTNPNSDSLKQMEVLQKQKDVQNMLQKLYDSGVLKRRPHKASKFDILFKKASGG